MVTFWSQTMEFSQSIFFILLNLKEIYLEFTRKNGGFKIQ